MKRYLPMLAIALVASAFTHVMVQYLAPARADQSERIVPTAGIFTGPQYAQKIGDALRSVSTANKGSGAPANVSGAVVDGLEWLDDTTSVWIKKRYVNGGWTPEAAYDSATSSYIGFLGGGGLGSIASATTTDLGTVQQANVSITGTTTIASFGSSAPTGAIKIIRFAGILTLTYSAALTVPTGGYDLVTAANDRAIVTHLGSGNWEVTQFTRANGIPVDVSAVGKIEFGVQSLPSLHVLAWGQALTRTSYPAYVAKATRAQNGTRTNANATITVADTSGYGTGMPVEGTGINAGCTIASWVADTSITLNSSACVTSSGTSTVTVFLTGYGSGGSSTTIGAPGCTGRFLAGREPTAANLTTSYFGGNSTSMMKTGGLESVTMASANIYQHLHAVFLNIVDPGHFHSSNPTVFSSGGGAGLAANNSGSVGSFGFNTDSKSTGIATSSTVRDTTGGGGTANQTANAGSATPTPMRTVPPALIADCFVRVTP